MSDETIRAASVRRYLFYNEHRPSRAWMPTLELINERFSQQLHAALIQYLRPEVEITPPPIIQLIKFCELVQQLAVPSHLTLVSLKPLRGTMLLVVDAQLVSWIVEARFGGSGRFSIAIGNRKFSPFEQKSARRVVETVIEQFALAWQPIAAFEPKIVRHDTNPQTGGIASSDEYIIVSPFDVRLGRGGGKLTVCIPHVMLEPLHDNLVSDGGKEVVDHDPGWRQSLAFGLGRATIPLNVELASIDVTLGDLLRLRPGSVFEIDKPETVTVELNGVPLFRGRWGKHGRKIGVRIENQLPADAEVLKSGQAEEMRAGGNSEQ
jgi:flagellar motor switch protein FliM